MFFRPLAHEKLNIALLRKLMHSLCQITGIFFVKCPFGPAMSPSDFGEISLLQRVNIDNVNPFLTLRYPGIELSRVLRSNAASI